MAKKKKLNKSVVIGLLVAGALSVLLAGALVYKFRRSIFPKDPVICLQKGKAALEKGDWVNAEVLVGESVNYAPDDARKAPYLYEYSKVLVKCLENQPDLNTAQKDNLRKNYRVALQQAVVRDPNFVDAQKALADLVAPFPDNYIREATALLKLTPNDHETYFRRGIAWARKSAVVSGENTEKALQDFRKAIELKPDMADYRLTYAMFLRQSDRNDAAQKAYEEGIALLPNDPALRLGYADLLNSRKKPEEALKQIQEAVTRAPKNPSGYIALASYYYTKKDYEAAAKALDQAQAIDDSEPMIYSLRATVFQVQKQPDKAIEALRNGLKVVTAKIETKSTTAPADNQQARLQMSQKSLRLSLANTLLDSIARNPDKKASLLAEAKDLLKTMDVDNVPAPGPLQLAGRIAFIEGDYEKSLKYLEPVFNNTGDSATAQWLATIYITQGLPGKANAVVDRLRKNPAYTGDPRILLIKAQMELYDRNLDEAQRYIEQALKADPNNENAQNLQRTVQVMRGKGTVEEAFGPDGKLSPQALGFLMDRARALWNQEDKAEAIKLLEGVLAKAGDVKEIQLLLSSFYEDIGEIDRAKALVQKVRAANPNLAAAADLRLKYMDEKDPAKRIQIELAMADLTTDPLRKALNKAEVCRKANDEAGWLKYLQEAEKVNPESPEVLENLLNYSILKKDWKTAEDYVQRAAKVNADSVGGKVFAAKLAVIREQYPQAIAALAEVVKNRPELKYPAVMLGECYMKTKDYAKAQDVYETLAKNDPAYLPALLGMAVVTAEQGKANEHAEWVGRAYRRNPNNPYIQREYLQLQEQNARPDEVIVQRQKMFQSDPNNFQNCAVLAALYEQTNQPDKAEKLYRHLMQASPQKLVAAALMANFYARIGRVSDGERLLTPFLASWPDKCEAYLQYGNFLANTSPGQARTAIQKALDLDPNSRRALLMMVQLEQKDANWPAAAEAIKKYVEHYPEDKVARRDYVIFCGEAKMFPQAQQEIESLLKSDPTSADLLGIKANLAIQQGEPAKAIEILDKALQFNNNDPRLLFAQAKIYSNQGDLVKAKATLQKARAGSKNPAIAVELARLQMQMGDSDSAQAVLSDVLDKADPNESAGATIMLARIYLNQKRWPKLTEILAQAKKNYPNDPSFLMLEAEMYRASGDKAKTVSATEQTLKAAPRSREALGAYLLALLEVGEYGKIVSATTEYAGEKAPPEIQAICAEALAKQGKASQADEQFAAAMKASPLSGIPAIVAHLKTGLGLETASAKVSEWVKANPREPRFLIASGILANEAQNFTAAAEAYSKAAALANTPAEKAQINRDLGVNYYAMKQFGPAEQAFLEALKTNPNDAMTLNNLAYLYVNDANKVSAALPYAAKAAQLESSNPDVLDTYGWVLAKSGKNTEAESSLLRAVEFSASPAAAALSRYHLGWVYEQTRRPADAIRQYKLAEDALKDKPEDPLAKDVAAAQARIQQKQTP
ncbi:MAG: tetratricopeptide repeat protein [Phycisphaerae bacterium]|jgi:FimV-like protein